METEDTIYLIGMVLIGVGTALYSIGAACVVVGALLVTPVVVNGIARALK